MCVVRCHLCEVPVFKNDGKRSAVKHCCPGSLFSAASEIDEKLVNNTQVDHTEKCGLLSDSHKVSGPLIRPCIF